MTENATVQVNVNDLVCVSQRFIHVYRYGV